MFRRYAHTLVFLTTLLISSHATTATAQVGIVSDPILEKAIPASLAELETTIKELLQGPGSENIKKLMSTVYGNINPSTITPPPNKAEWDNIEKGLIAGLTTQPTAGATGVADIYNDDPTKAGQTVTPGAMYANRQQLINYTKFHTFDYPYNPDHGKKSYKPDTKTAGYLSFDSLLTASNTDASNHYIATVINPQNMPRSIQDYLNEQYPDHKDNFKKPTLRPDVVTIQNYQAKRRRFLAMQSAALSNLRSIQNMNTDNAAKDNLQKVINSEGDIKTASAITVARLNLMVNMMVANELKKRREIDQRMLGTMSMLLLQNLDSLKQSLEVSSDGSKSDFKSVKEYIDGNFNITDDNPTDTINQDGS